MATTIKAEVAGTVYELAVSTGDEVDAGQTVLVLESMKMEIPVESTSSGRVTELLVKAGDVVSQGQALVVISA